MNFCLWLTGLPGSGKSTIAREVERLFTDAGLDFVTLSMDRIRKFVTPDPGYTEEERETVYRSLVFMAQLIVEHSNKNVIIDATGNRRVFRNLARERIPDFAEVYVKCPLETCRSRETSRDSQNVEKNLYQKAQTGQMKGKMPGVSVPYEEPLDPEVLVESDCVTPRESAEKIMEYVLWKWGV